MFLCYFKEFRQTPFSQYLTVPYPLSLISLHVKATLAELNPLVLFTVGDIDICQLIQSTIFYVWTDFDCCFWHFDRFFSIYQVSGCTKFKTALKVKNTADKVKCHPMTVRSRRETRIGRHTQLFCQFLFVFKFTKLLNDLVTLEYFFRKCKTSHSVYRILATNFTKTGSISLYPLQIYLVLNPALVVKCLCSSMIKKKTTNNCKRKKLMEGS
jgi:hypothetical protein